MEQVYENGVHDISNEQYHSSGGISRSRLMSFKKSAKNYWFDNISGLSEKDEPTPEMNLGSAVHTLVLEPKLFSDEFFVTHQQTMPRKDTAPHEKMMDEADGRIILTMSAHKKALNVATAVMNNNDAMALLSGCKIEQSIYFTHKLTGLQCKARPDAWSGNLALDLKTTNDASYRAFQRSAMDYGYFLQAAMMYRALESIGIDMDDFGFIAVEKNPPYLLAIYTVNKDSLEYGLKLFDDLMLGLKHCLDNNSWPGYGIKELNVPSWAKNCELMEIE